MINFIDKHPVLFFTSLISLVFATVTASWIGKSYFEAQAYNRLTGAHATTWDAMWVELRVQAQPQ